jgi:hypothetical protein
MFITGMTALVIYRLFAGSGTESPFDLLEANGVMDRRAIWLVVGLGTLMLCAFVFFYAIVIVATHRVAGPILLMTRYMTELSQGRYPVMRALRENDELKDFFSLFRGLVDRLRSKDQDEAKALGAALDALATVQLNTGAQEAVNALRVLREAKIQNTSGQATQKPADDIQPVEEVALSTAGR